MAALKPYNINNLVVGAPRVLYAPTSQAVPTDISQIIAMTSPYAPQGAWLDFGAAKSSSSYSRDIESEGLEIQQETGAVIEEVTQVDRVLSTSIAELTPESQKIIENAPAIETVAAAAGRSAQKRLKIGSFTDLTQYRIALIGTRKIQSGTVTEPGGATRGRLICVTLYRTQVAADSVEEEFEKGELVEAPVDFVSFPEAGQASGQEYGTWLYEDAGTIT